MSEPLVRHITDTARWVAVYRARESERQDALFRDPFARRLAGERGEQIAASLPFHDQNAWSYITRTYLFDLFIAHQIRQGTDLVVNLAAGLDARPYRMALPPELIWVDVDMPEILDYKEEILDGENPACNLESIRLDLADVAARRALFEAFGKRATKALILTEGLLIYLREDEVGALAEDLARPPTFQHWAVDIASPGLLRMLQQNTQAHLGAAGAQLRFAPESGPQFFAEHNWRPVDVRSLLKTAGELKRLPAGMEPLALAPEDTAHMGDRPWAGVCLLERA